MERNSSSSLRISSSALSSSVAKSVEARGCWAVPWTDGFADSAASARARTSATLLPARSTSVRGSSWSSSASSRCSG